MHVLPSCQGRLLAHQDTPPTPPPSFQSTPVYIYVSVHGRQALPAPDGEAMEEFQEADILWPGSGDKQQDITSVTKDDDATSIALPSKLMVSPPPEPSASVEISRRKRRCRPWASEHAMFDELTAVINDEEARDDLTMIVPPHVLVARRRLGGGGRTAAYSMCAGKGRTLKGRDLRDVRNRVLKMTGFIEK
ncbi:hypothetical protein PR202_ga05752 [Eleusine coracana subsp. coracana]|uniref:Senescence regulator n=1 Tax=Eleusine coracana subsp. coracana TaxID=191504 RepID=A0AAV5BT76_ELECO|nr:hypothetical protein PR202_ga05752 [Eleusine coracana subsp. coracana]